MGEFAWPFGLGIVAAFNPCGFAMLPAYLSYFLGIESKENDQTRLTTVVRALAVGLVMTMGFIAVFGAFGILFATVINQGDIADYIPWVIGSIGVLLIPLGIAMLMGKNVTLRLPKMNKGTGSRNLGSVFMFGVSYAVVSLSCTVGIFISGIANSFEADGIAQGTGNFLAYAIGMGMVITFLTMSLARAKSNVAVSMRKLLPYINPIGGVLLIIAGIYMIDYGIWDYQVVINNNFDAGNLLVDHFLEFQSAVEQWILATTTERIGLVALMGIIGLLVAAWRDDLTDPYARNAAGIVYLAVLALIEAWNKGEFILFPIARFIANWPARIANWFTDPLRAGVVLEILFVAFVGWIVWRRVDRYRPQHAPGAVSAA
ncbi:MAG: cytochrome c biogenesis CcdA family protein [Actinomycetota bacterium]